jgi:uncharacterized membrane protein
MTLETWLETARLNLAPRARELVLEQITDHFETAKHRYQLEGQAEQQAEKYALRDLGDAKKAARGFEKAYLTDEEVNSWKKYKESMSSILVVMALLAKLIFFAFAIISLKSQMHSSIFLLLYLAPQIPYVFIRFLWSKNLDLKTFISFSGYSDPIFFFLQCVCVFAYTKDSSDLYVQVFLGIFYVIFGIYTLFSNFKMIAKVKYL